MVSDTKESLLNTFLKRWDRYGYWSLYIGNNVVSGICLKSSNYPSPKDMARRNELRGTWRVHYTSLCLWEFLYVQQRWLSTLANINFFKSAEFSLVILSIYFSLSKPKLLSAAWIFELTCDVAITGTAFYWELTKHKDLFKVLSNLQKQNQKTREDIAMCCPFVGSAGAGRLWRSSPRDCLRVAQVQWQVAWVWRPDSRGPGGARDRLS